MISVFVYLFVFCLVLRAILHVLSKQEWWVRKCTKAWEDLLGMRP